ncbi:MAG: hypothetical protein HOV87_18570 [Catenulispora sp.]|nr:hypothetical protein [Catenulispora sp.]
MRIRTTLAASSSTLLFACGGGVAHATDGPSAAGGTLPVPGTSFAVSENGDLVMECDGVVHRIEVHGAGRLQVGDQLTGKQVPIGQPTFAVSTDAEELTGHEAELGTVTVSAKEPVVGEFTAASAARPYPAAQSLGQDVTVTMEHSPCRAGQRGVYASKAAFPLLNTDLTDFPPRNAVYQLTTPVELDDVSDPSAAPFTLTGFVVTVDRLP